MKPIRHTLVAAALCALSTSGFAAITAAEAERLTTDLTPNGAERAGNKDGTIPAWTGGIGKPPAGWKPEMGYTDPFAAEKPLFTITAANAEQHKDKLSPGMLAMLKKYPNFAMPVYPSHRSFSNPQEVYDATKAQATKVALEGLSLRNYNLPGTPFPIPKTGVEAILNQELRWYGAYNRCAEWLPVRADGSFYRVGFCEDLVQGQNIEPRQGNNHLFSFFGYYDAPATLVGTIYLVHDPIDFTTAERQAWVYNAGQRRVRRAPNIAYDNIEDGTEGMRITDDYNGYNGALDRYDYKLVGKREMYIPYNGYKLHDARLKYTDMLDKGSIKSELMRYELHRVWVVEATLKSGMSHVYAKRTFYLDEDSYLVAMQDAYDSRGNLWRAYLNPPLQAYDGNSMFLSAFIAHDLTNGNYIVTGLTNERKQPAYKWNAKAKWDDFQVDAMRRRGTR